jgi:hypothetical protein
MGGLNSLIVIAKAFMCIACINGAGNAQIEWPTTQEFSTADRDAIITLAKKMGIENPKRVFFGQTLPDLCGFVSVESAVTDAGHLRSWLELQIRRQDWEKCYDAPPGSKTRRAGRWIARNTDLLKREEWRIEDNEWHLYLRFGPGVSFEDAELAVLAIRHGQLINRLPTADNQRESDAKVPMIDPSAISYIVAHGSDAHTYDLYTGSGSGRILTIKIVDGKVELHEYRAFRV